MRNHQFLPFMLTVQYVELAWARTKLGFFSGIYVPNFSLSEKCNIRPIKKDFNSKMFCPCCDPHSNRGDRRRDCCPTVTDTLQNEVLLFRLAYPIICHRIGLN
ncbi:hypothetical protein ATANTOWER_009293 [Ataeniobius toweri]|uniref:Secreted protein n=1 Tax=Ataeniobius toweri TaxID=208326 RepID=A0ABU7BY79_9TELE|nr:hypothetical protein [Ataeniobius toweri]